MTCAEICWGEGQNCWWEAKTAGGGGHLALFLIFPMNFIAQWPASLRPAYASGVIVILFHGWPTIIFEFMLRFALRHISSEIFPVEFVVRGNCLLNFFSINSAFSSQLYDNNDYNFMIMLITRDYETNKYCFMCTFALNNWFSVDIRYALAMRIAVI